jgi:hypothetical protein
VRLRAACPSGRSVCRPWMGLPMRDTGSSADCDSVRANAAGASQPEPALPPENPRDAGSTCDTRNVLADASSTCRHARESQPGITPAGKIGRADIRWHARRPGPAGTCGRAPSPFPFRAVRPPAAPTTAPEGRLGCRAWGHWMQRRGPQRGSILRGRCGGAGHHTGRADRLLQICQHH